MITPFNLKTVELVSVSADDIARVGLIDIRFDSTSSDDMTCLSYEKLQLPRYGEH